MANTDTVQMELTSAGFALLGKVVAGITPLTITGVVIGDGFLSPGETIADLAALKHAISNVTVEIVSNTIIGDGRSKMLVRMTGQNQDFYLREIGIMATDPDEGEILYSYCNYGDLADYVMTYAGAAPVMQEGEIYFITGEGELIIEISHDTASVTHAEFEAHTGDSSNPHGVTAAQIFPDNSGTLTQITADRKAAYDSAASAAHGHSNKSVLDTITQAFVTAWNSAASHINRSDNPHRVTKSQVGLGNVPNVTTNDQTPTYADRADALATLSSGEKISAAFAKIKQAITSLINHIANRSNPHGVTAAQIFPDNSGTLTQITADRKVAYDSAASAAHGHSNKSVLDTITQAFVTAWNSAVSHISDTSNPHNVTASDVGLGNVTNESKATMFSSPNFTGSPRATTPTTTDNSTRIATTAFAQNLIEEKIGNLLTSFYIGDLDNPPADGTYIFTNCEHSNGMKAGYLTVTRYSSQGRITSTEEQIESFDGTEKYMRTQDYGQEWGSWTSI